MTIDYSPVDDAVIVEEGETLGYLNTPPQGHLLAPMSVRMLWLELLCS